MRSTSQAARPSARGCDTDQYDCDVWWNRLSQGRASSGFPCWNRGRERSDAIPRARGAHVGRWKTTVIAPLTPITIMRQLGANIRMKESGDVLAGHVHNQLDFFSREGWKLSDSLRAQLKHDPFIARQSS